MRSGLMYSLSGGFVFIKCAKVQVFLKHFSRARFRYTVFLCSSEIRVQDNRKKVKRAGKIIVYLRHYFKFFAYNSYHIFSDFELSFKKKGGIYFHDVHLPIKLS
jgi:hypothetical protein